VRKIGVLAQSVARSLHPKDDGVIPQSVKQRGSDDGIAIPRSRSLR
jgi:hypothetical protein